jgi:hypothetical protein
MTTAEILAGFPKLSALVVGDICLDRWCTYDPATSEASRETQIPRIGVVRTEVTAGAGGTVANNLAALGVGRLGVLSVAGDDGFGYELARALTTIGVTSDMLISAPGKSTFTYKTNQSPYRRLKIGRESTSSPTPPLDTNRAQVLTDYRSRRPVRCHSDLDQAETCAGGVVTPAVRERLGNLAVTHPEKNISGGFPRALSCSGT